MILDKNIRTTNYASFQSCDISNDGKSVIFIMKCGDSYQVALDYFLKWFSNPHYLLSNNKMVEWGNEEYNFHNKDISFVSCEPILSNTAIRIFLSNGAIYDVPWDTVLMTCEERYEHFGGLTEESKRIVEEFGPGQKKMKEKQGKRGRE